MSASRLAAQAQSELSPPPHRADSQARAQPTIRCSMLATCPPAGATIPVLQLGERVAGLLHFRSEPINSATAFHARAILSRNTAKRSPPASERIRSTAPRSTSSACFSSVAIGPTGSDAAQRAAASPATLPKTPSSASELEPSRLAPWRPMLEHSPTAEQSSQRRCRVAGHQDATHCVMDRWAHRDRVCQPDRSRETIRPARRFAAGARAAFGRRGGAGRD